MGLKTKYEDIDNKNDPITIKNSSNESINKGAINTLIIELSKYVYKCVNN